MINVVVQRPDIPSFSLNITQFGAVGDGQYDNTAAFRQAIQACSDSGGGRIIIPAGIWLTGPIELKSKIELHAEFGALIQFSKRYDDYKLIVSSFEGIETVRCQSPIDGEGLENIAITGEGVFDGGGEAWRPVKKSKMTELEWQVLVDSGGVVDEEELIWWPSEQAMKGRSLVEMLMLQTHTELADYEPARQYLRPNLLSLRRCKRILLEGPTFQNSPAWNVHPWACEHITIRNVTIRNPWNSQNGDGLDLESCKYALVERCSFDVGDDAICLKSGKDKMGRDLGLACEYITIRNCYVYHGHGGFVIGSEMSGGVRHVEVSDCIFMGTDIGLRFKSSRGRGGVVENISISNIQMTNIIHEAISFHLFYEGTSGSGSAKSDRYPVTEETPIFRNIQMNNIICTGAQKALIVNGLAEMPVENLNINGLQYVGEEGIVCHYLSHSTLNNIDLRVTSKPEIKLNECHNVHIYTNEEDSN